MNPKQKKILQILIAIVLAWSLINQFVLKRFKYKYKNFGISIPMGYSIHGIDVSKYQTQIDWNDVKAMNEKGIQIDFAVIKATEGLSLKDRCFEDNWENSKDAGVLRGAYHYFHPNLNGQMQAKYFASFAKIKKGDLSPVIDIEETNGVSNKELQKQLLDCCNELENTFDEKPIIYCNADFYKAHLSPEFDSYPLWVAHYKVNQPDINRDWIMWQHNDGGHVNGIKGFVDFNVANGNLVSLKKYTIK